MKATDRKKSARGVHRATTAIKIPSSAQPLLLRVGRAASQEGVSAYAVGGCVRDWALGRPTVDLDVVVEGDGIAFAKRLGPRLGASVITHEQFGTATLSWPAGEGGLPRRRVRRPADLTRLDIASCRKERYAKPAAYPTVSPGALRDDLFRRDFTLNAMALALEPSARFGRLVDPFGGWRDLQARRLRILHPKSFLDDPSRILRAARFVERFGLTVEPSTARRLQAAMAKGMLAQLNRGRVQKELARMAEEPNPQACRQRLEQWLGASS